MDTESQTGGGQTAIDPDETVFQRLRPRGESSLGERAVPEGGPAPTPAAHGGPEYIGRFLVLDIIGSGGMGELYLGWDDQLDRRVAIKLVHARRRTKAADQRLHREAKALGQISHPNVVPVFDVGVHDQRIFMAMEFVHGQTLDRWLEQLQLRGADRVRAIFDHFLAAGRGLLAVHRVGLAHRDFKPENVLVGSDGRVRIVDFGLARSTFDEDDTAEGPSPQQIRAPGVPSPVEIVDSDVLRSPTLTETGALVGTPRYMAPEQWLGLRGDSRSDQFSFCVALFEALYGRRPFDAPNMDALSQVVCEGELEPPPRRKDVPRAAREAILRGLSPRPDQRFEDIGELLETLEPKARSRRPLALLALLVLALLLLGASQLAKLTGTGGEDSSFTNIRREVAAVEHLARVGEQLQALEAAGKHAEADAIFQAFAELPEHEGTSALTRAWLEQARRLGRRGEHEAEIDAYAEAYLSSSSSQRQQALIGLARSFESTRQWQRLAPTLSALEAAGAERPLDPRVAEELQRMRVRALAARRDLVGAAQLLEPVGDEGPGVRDAALRAAILELSRVRSTQHHVDGANLRLAPLPGLDLDDDGVGELILRGDGERELRVLGTAGARLETLARVEVPGEPAEDIAVVAGTARPTLSLRQGSELSLMRLRARDRRVTAKRLLSYEQASERPGEWVLADLDDDGREHAYLALEGDRQLLAARVTGGPARARFEEPHPATTATSSVVHALSLGDLDGDGAPELAVAVGEWTAYDLRVFGPRPDGELELLARRKLGAVHSVASFPAPEGPGRWIAAGVAEDYPSLRVFPREAPAGEPGLHLLAWTGEALEPRAHFDLPWPKEIHVGDFDGNGLHDLALAIHTDEHYRCTLLLQLGPGRFEELEIGDLWPVGAVDLDGDGDHELLAITAEHARDPIHPHGQLFVLGTGRERLPVVEQPPLPAAPPSRPADAKRELADARERAEELALIGLPLRAATRLRELAQVAPPKLAAELRLRAAELFATQGQRLAAAELFAAAAADPDRLANPELALAARRRASELFAATHRFEAALRLAEAARTLADEHGLDAEISSATLTRLRGLAEPGPPLEFEFDTPLDARWAVDPLALRRRQGRLELELGGVEQDPVLRRELIWDGGPLSLEVDVEIESMEWSGELAVELRPVGGEASLTVGVTAWGGGGIYQLQFRCADEGVAEPGSRTEPFDHPRATLDPSRRRFELRAELIPDRHERWCSASLPDGSRLESAIPDARRSPGRYELIVRGSGASWPRAKLSIDRIALTGARDPDRLDQPVDPFHAIGRELAEGRGESVLTALAGTPALDEHERALLEFLAHDELGHWRETERALATVLGLDPRRRKPGTCGRDDASAIAFGTLLRHRPERLGPTLRELCSTESYFRALFEVWSVAIFQHPDSEAVARVLTTQTAGLERWVPVELDDRLAMLILLRTRAEAWSTQGAHSAARADLARAVDFGERWQDELDARARDGDALALARELGRARTALAANLLDRGDERRALATLRRALELSPTPELLADTLVIDARFASLHDRPLWRDLVEPARAGRPATPAGPGAKSPAR